MTTIQAAYLKSTIKTYRFQIRQRIPLPEGKTNLIFHINLIFKLMLRKVLIRDLSVILYLELSKVIKHLL
jgi:hypothetical protein